MESDRGSILTSALPCAHSQICHTHNRKVTGGPGRNCHADRNEAGTKTRKEDRGWEEKRETRALRAVSSRDETLSGLPVRHLPCPAMDKGGTTAGLWVSPAGCWVEHSGQCLCCYLKKSVEIFHSGALTRRSGCREPTLKNIPGAKSPSPSPPLSHYFLSLCPMQ